ncbi:MAG: LPS export ABC transporter permease LptG [Nitrospinota bacterium]
MRIVRRYVLREFLRLFGLALAAALNIFLIAEFIERIDDFIEKGAELGDALAYFIYKIPLMLYWSAPLAVLLATILSLLLLSRNNEVTAMRACGISLYSIVKPILLAGLLLSAICFLANEYIIPYTNRQVNHIFNVKIKKYAPRGLLRQNRIWYRSEDNTIWHIEAFDPRTDTMKDVTLYRLDERNRLSQRVDARLVRWDGEGWLFEEGVVREFPAEGVLVSRSFDSRRFILPEKPADFKQTHKEPEEMSFAEMRSYIQGLRANGFDTTKYAVDLQAKLAFPLVSFIMVLVGIPFSLKTSRSGGVALGIGLTFLIGFSYVVLFYLGISLGHAGRLPPLLSAWSTNIIFVGTGLYLMTGVRS